MSEEIDMQSYAGEIGDSAAEGQQIGASSNQQQVLQEEYPVDQGILNQVKSEVDRETPKPDSNPQAEHFRALREEVDRIKAERETEKREYQQQLELLHANLNSRQPVNSEPQRSKRMFDGMEETDIPNVSEIRKAWEQRESEYQAKIEELEIAQRYPDYAEVLEKYLVPLIKEKPHLAGGIQGASNKALFAYELGKMRQQQVAQQVATPKSTVAQKIVENSRKPGTLSSAGGQGALSKADYYASMSDTDFMQFASRNLGEI